MYRQSLCGANCAECLSLSQCKGCKNTRGCPFGTQCFVAKYLLTDGEENYRLFKQGLIDEINALGVEGMETVRDLYPMLGKYVNLSYPLPNGDSVKFLKDDEIYLGSQVKNVFDESGKMSFGVIARENFLLVCEFRAISEQNVVRETEYQSNCEIPEIVLFKRR